MLKMQLRGLRRTVIDHPAGSPERDALADRRVEVAITCPPS